MAKRTYEHEGRKYDVQDDGDGRYVITAARPTANPLYENVMIEAGGTGNGHAQYRVVATGAAMNRGTIAEPFYELEKALRRACKCLTNPADDGTDRALEAMRDWIGTK